MLQNLLLQLQLRHQSHGFRFFLLQLFQSFGLIQFCPAKFLPPAVEGLRCGLDFVAGLRGGLSVRDLDFNLPQQRHDLLRLVFPHRHTSFPPE